MTVKHRAWWLHCVFHISASWWFFDIFLTYLITLLNTIILHRKKRKTQLKFLPHKRLFFIYLVVMSSSWNFLSWAKPSRAKKARSWGISILQLKLSCQFFITYNFFSWKLFFSCFYKFLNQSFFEEKVCYSLQRKN